MGTTTPSPSTSPSFHLVHCLEKISSRSSLSSRTLVSVFCFRLQTGFVTRVDASIGIIVTFYDNVHGLVPAKSLAKLHRGSSATNGGSAAPPAPLSAAELASSYV